MTSASSTQYFLTITPKIKIKLKIKKKARWDTLRTGAVTRSWLETRSWESDQYKGGMTINMVWSVVTQVFVCPEIRGRLQCARTLCLSTEVDSHRVCLCLSFITSLLQTININRAGASPLSLTGTTNTVRNEQITASNTKTLSPLVCILFRAFLQNIWWQQAPHLLITIRESAVIASVETSSGYGLN